MFLMDMTHSDQKGVFGSEENGEFTDGHQDRPEDHSESVTEVLVSHSSTEDRRGIDQAGVGSVDQRCVRVSLHQGFHQIEREQRSHSVVAESLPHFGEEQGHQTVGVLDLICTHGVGFSLSVHRSSRKEPFFIQSCSSRKRVIFR